MLHNKSIPIDTVQFGDSEGKENLTTKSVELSEAQILIKTN